MGNIIGEPIEEMPNLLSQGKLHTYSVTYNPYKHTSFINRDDNFAVWKSDYALLHITTNTVLTLAFDERKSDA